LDLIGCCSTVEQVAVPTSIKGPTITPSATMDWVARSSNLVLFFRGSVVGTVITAVAIVASSTTVIRFIDAG